MRHVDACKVESTIIVDSHIRGYEPGKNSVCHEQGNFGIQKTNKLVQRELYFTNMTKALREMHYG